MIHIFFTLFFLILPNLSPPAAANITASTSTVFTSVIFNGFRGANLTLNGAAVIEPSGRLLLTNNTKQEIGRAFFSRPFRFLNSSSSGNNLLSFSTSFVFAIIPQYHDISSEGIAFAISPSTDLSAALPSQHLGLFNLSNNGAPSNHIVAVKLDTTQNKEFNDIDDNHLSININGLQPVSSASAAFFSHTSGKFKKLNLISREPMRVWAEYDSHTMRFNVSIAPLDAPKPSLPLLSPIVNLSSVILGDMYCGFSSSTGAVAGSHYILGWSFSMNGKAEEFNLSQLPRLPQPREEGARKINYVLLILLPLAITWFLLMAISGLLLLLNKRRKFAEVFEEWETEYGSHRFEYNSLYKATGGFTDENVLGNGGFGEVYKGLLPKSKQEIAVKKISHDSRQGVKEFVAEIATIGRLRHRNLVQLLGYSRRQNNLILVYEFMPNGSLEKYLFGKADELLSWRQRFKIIKGIAAGLLYLHEEWEQVVLHRDIKASNVLLDADFNGKLGDFGLARLHDRGSIAQTTRVIGTLGYLAPELSRTGKSTTSSDVFSFGAFLLEVSCGKKPIVLRTSGIEMVLVDWVLGFLERGKLLMARDRRLGADFAAEEVEMVLRLGLLCSHPAADSRPSMKQVVQYLERLAPLPQMTSDDLCLFHSKSIRNGLVVDDVSTTSSSMFQSCGS